MSAWSRCGQPSCWQTPFFHSLLRGTSGQRSSPSRSGLTAAQTSMNGWPTISTCGPERGAVGSASAIRLSLEPGDQVVDQDADPALAGRDGSRAGGRPGRRRRRGTPRPRPRSAGRRPRPSRPARRRAGPRRRSGSAGPPGPWRRGRRPSRTPYASASRARSGAGAARITGRPSSRKPGPERERTPLAAAVLEGDGVQVAVDGDDLAAEVGGDLLDDRAQLGRGLDGAAALRGAPVGGEDVGAVAVAGRSPDPR